MGRPPKKGTTAPWEALYELASEQSGYFSAAQASRLGFSTARLQYHVNAGKLERRARGVLRLRHFPASTLEEYVVHWLWSEQEGVFSHDTALMLHELSDAMPAKIHLTVPAAWATRRLRVPRELVLHFADVPERERTWKEYFPITAPRRTLQDCIRDHSSPELVAQAVRQAKERGLISGEVAHLLEAAP
jgi:predicted transcriptional regulator of viral defense system